MASRETQSLARILQKIRERLLINAYYTSQFGYCLLVWITFPELLEKNKSLTIRSRYLQALAYELFKMKNSIVPETLRNFLPQGKQLKSKN